jgi:hypothetical protein
MIASSPRHNGYSIFAAEYLLRSIMTMPEGEAPGKTRVNWIEMLKKEFPADYWSVTSKVRKTDNPKALRDSARSKCYYLRSQEKKKYLTFKGQRFQISHIAIGVAFIVAMVPLGHWQHFPGPQRVYDALGAGKNVVEFKYRGGVAKFEVER